MENYSKNFDRSSKAGCRAVLDLLLNECLTVLVSRALLVSDIAHATLDYPQKGNHVEKGAQETSDRWQKSPTSFSDIRVYSEVTFNHKILPVSKTQQSTSSPAVTVHGRLDYGIGRVLVPTTEAAAVRLRSRFQCLLVIVEATAQRAVGQALPQLLLYLACLRQSRVQRRRTNASVYGVASDGYIFIFVQITHDGTVLISRNFNIQLGDMLEVLQCLRNILETTAAEMSPDVTPERDVQGADDLSDPAIDLCDNDYTNPPEDDELYG